MSEDEHVCDACGRRRATVHLTDLVDGRAVERHLCKQCYEETEGASLPPAEVLAQFLSAVAPELKEMSGRQCPVCGINYLEFRKSPRLRLGCPQDYEVFGAALEQIIDSVQGATSHCGKVPPGMGSESAQRHRILSLQKRQQKAVEREDYELAAELRDRIRQLKRHGSDQPQQ